MAFNQPTYGPRAVSNFEFESGLNPLDSVGGRFNDIAAYLSGDEQGATLFRKSAIQTIPVAAAATLYDLNKFIPAGVMVSNIGIFFTENCQMSGGTGTVKFGFGSTSLASEIVTSTPLNGAGEDISVNQFVATNLGNAATTGGSGLVIAPGAQLWFANESTLYFKVTTNIDLAATCEIKIVMEYFPISNS